MQYNKKNLQTILFSSVCIVGTFLFLLITTEAGYRIFHWWRIKQGNVRFLLLEKPLYAFDAVQGYRYIPSQVQKAHWIDQQGSIIRENKIQINVAGNVSEKDDLLLKSSGEYRIAVMGDSMTAGIHGNTPWPKYFEEFLNADSSLKSKLGIKNFRVFNFGRDGVGLVQMPNLLRHAVLPYKPDQVLVSFITADIYRRFLWRGPVELEKENASLILSCTRPPVIVENAYCSYADVVSLNGKTPVTEDLIRRVQKAAAEKLLAKFPWSSGYPLFLSWISNGTFDSFLGRNPLNPLTQSFNTPEESVIASKLAIQQMRKDFPRTSFILNPTVHEIIRNTVPGLPSALMNAVPEAKISPMLNYLPTAVEESTIRSWTNLPHDEHWSEIGVKIYAKAVYNYFKEQTFKQGLISSNEH